MGVCVWVNVMGAWVIFKKGLQIVLPAVMALPLPQQQQQLCAVERLTVSLTSSNLRHQDNNGSDQGHNF